MLREVCEGPFMPFTHAEHTVKAGVLPHREGCLSNTGPRCVRSGAPCLRFHGPIVFLPVAQVLLRSKYSSDSSNAALMLCYSDFTC